MWNLRMLVQDISKTYSTGNFSCPNFSSIGYWRQAAVDQKANRIIHSTLEILFLGRRHWKNFETLRNWFPQDEAKGFTMVDVGPWQLSWIIVATCRNCIRIHGPFRHFWSGTLSLPWRWPNEIVHIRVGEQHLTAVVHSFFWHLVFQELVCPGHRDWNKDETRHCNYADCPYENNHKNTILQINDIEVMH